MNNISFNAKLKVHHSLKGTASRKGVKISVPEIKNAFAERTEKYDYLFTVKGLDPKTRKNFIFELKDKFNTLRTESIAFSSVSLKDNCDSLCNVFFKMLNNYKKEIQDKKEKEAFLELMKGKVIGDDTEEMRHLIYEYIRLINTL